MSATLISLLAVTFGFLGLVAWVYWPSRKQDLESLGSMPLEDISEDRGERPNGNNNKRNDS